MTNEHDRDRITAIIPRTVDEAASLSTRFARANLLPPDLRGKEADVFVTILAGQELGLPPMAALRGIHILKGKPILSADTMVGVVLGRGVATYFQCVEETDASVTYETHREGSPKCVRMTWTMADAVRAGLSGGDNWRKYPRAMLKARCKAALARDVYPDVLAGCYEHGEADEIASPFRASPPALAVVETVIDAVAIDPDSSSTPTGDDEIAIALAEIEGARTADDLKKIAARITSSTIRDAVRSAYKARLAAVRA